MRRFLPLFPVVILAVSGCVVIGIGDQDKEDTGDTGDTTQPSDPLPEITSLELSPDPVYTGDTLSAAATTEHTESTEWSWFVNGEAAGDGSSTLDGEDWFDKEDVVEVRAIPVAGSVTGQAASLEIVVSNTAPGAPLVDINPLTPVEGVDTLLCFVSGDSEDDDGDEINYSATWAVDGVAHADTGQTNFPGDTIDPAATVAGQVWVCTVAPDDGEEQGASGSAEVEIVAPAVEYADCTGDLSGLGAPVEVATASGGGGYGIGAWMADANPGAAARVWVMMDYDDSQVVEYASVSDLQAGSSSRSVSLDEDWSGTGHVVLDGVIYYNEEDTPSVVAYDMDNGVEIARADLPGAGYHNTYPYSYGGRTDIDLSADNGSLYAVYSTPSAAGRIVVSELNPQTLLVSQSWTATSATKIDFSNTFVACGVLYGVDSEQVDGPCFYCTDTTVDLAWDFRNGGTWEPALNFTSPGSSGYIGAVDYNPADGLIYVMRGGVMGTLEPSWN